MIEEIKLINPLKDFFEENKDKHFCFFDQEGTCNIIGYNENTCRLIVKTFVSSIKENFYNADEQKAKLINYIQENRVFICMDKAEYSDKEVKNKILIEEVDIDNLCPMKYFNNSWYKDFFDVFSKNSIRTKKSILFDFTKYLLLKDAQEKYSIIIDQDYTQKDKNSFCLYISVGNDSVLGIFDRESISDIFFEAIKYTHFSEFISLMEIVRCKDKYIFEEFIKNSKNEKIIKDSLAYRLIGLRANNMTKIKDFEVIQNLFETLNEQIEIDEKGNLIYIKDI